MKLTEQMLTLVNALPEPDRGIAIELIKKRNFEVLQELVSSAITKTERNLSSESPKEVYINTNMADMESLLSIVENYLLVYEDLEDIIDDDLLIEDELIMEEEEN